MPKRRLPGIGHVIETDVADIIGEVVGPIPEDYGRYLDAVAAVPAKAAHQDLGAQFIAYATQLGTFPIWYSRGIDPRKGAY